MAGREYRSGNVFRYQRSRWAQQHSPQHSPQIKPLDLAGSPSTPATEATPTRQSSSANQITPSSGRRSRSSSPEELLASPTTCSANPTTKSENMHLEPSQAGEGIDVLHAKHIRVGEPVAEHALPLEYDATLSLEMSPVVFPVEI
ncbi:hypothetical protein ARMGADRAFT_661888 [Armillaria gallica]|uniref:Uncharacterized protein n=1 Tax=Armillaria gallica TaxID=47427 RepID=A0A2H3EBL6_ARMGA|nr:hypothetical protein ARMGADRAFT_661888 [Armillaria gallica]